MTKFVDIDKIGSGGFGVVIKCKRDPDGELFARKLLLLEDEGSIKRFQREVRILSKLAHPRIIRIEDTHVDAKPYWFVMPLYKNSLRDVMPSVVGDRKEIAAIFESVLEGMEYAHEQGVIHRDLKPENILHGEDGSIVVSDYLVGNAIKFTHAGEVALKVAEETADGEDRVLHFTVSDTGIGVPAEKQKLIFDPFSQADASTTRKYGGTGLGLTISARLVNVMGGRIWVESQVGSGTRFHFTARLKTSGKKVEVGTIAPPEILRGVAVLIVDDNRTNRRILEGMLKRWDMKPVSVEGGAQALAELATARDGGKPYRLVLTDMHMPDMDGFTLIERIRQSPSLSTATIMMLTSAGHRGDAERCKTWGVAAYLLKPVRQSELREAIARVLGAREQAGAIPLITRYSLQDARDPSEILSILLAEDNLVNQRLATRLLEKRGHRVSLAATGREALTALEKQAYDLVLMDVQMPEMDGLEATSVIRQAEKETGAHQAVIALTAHAMKGDQERCLAAGIDGYLTKPIHAQELDEILDRYVALRKEKAAATSQSPSAAEQPVGQKS